MVQVCLNGGKLTQVSRWCYLFVRMCGRRLKERGLGAGIPSMWLQSRLAASKRTPPNFLPLYLFLKPYNRAQCTQPLEKQSLLSFITSHSDTSQWVLLSHWLMPQWALPTGNHLSMSDLRGSAQPSHSAAVGSTHK